MTSLRTFLLNCSLFFWGTAVCIAQNPQAQLERISPVSPTAAAITQYGNIPVSNFTGSPGISIPLYEVSSGSLKVPVGLNYQYNGLKVEEMASWVGLGWSLQAGGAISRSKRGIEDEGPYGYINQATGQMTVKFMIDNMTNPTYENDIKYNLKEAGKGAYDTEPDIFHFSFPGGSGKFFYNQEDQKFYTLPAQNIDVQLGWNGFILTTEEGTRYHFTASELTASNSPVCTFTPSVAGTTYTITSWFLTKIENKTQTDSITFEYIDTYYTFDNISTHSNYYLTNQAGTIASGSVPPSFNNSNCTQTSALNGKRLSYIRFRNGYLKFSVFSFSRCDLYGDKALEKIELFNAANQLQRRFMFTYGYFGDAGFPSNCTASDINLRLKLISVREESADGQLQKPYQIEYEETGMFPSRLSFAQDYWGYYNGKSANQSLIPPAVYTNAQNIPILLPGADRDPNFFYANQGSIKKLVYPTGGYTEFTFENNEVNDTMINPGVQWITQSIEGDHNGGIQTVYEKEFTVNESPNVYNNDNPNGGAFIDVTLEAIGCDLSGGANTCAILTLDGLSAGTVSWGPFLNSTSGLYIPNGTYRLRASFNQNPPMYEDFYFAIKWKRPSTETVIGRLVGGLRIKKIVDYDNIDAAKKIVRNFSYARDTDGKSSGKVCGYPNNYSSYFNNEFYSGDAPVGYCVEHILSRLFFKRTSVSNYPLIAQQGSYVGYEMVTVNYGDNGENGKTVYRYQFFSDVLNDFPAWSTSREFARGLLMNESIYKNVSGNLSLQKKDTIVYGSLRDVDVNLLKVAYGIKPAFTTTFAKDDARCGFAYWIQRENELAVPTVSEYETVTDYSPPASQTSYMYEGGNQIQTVTQYAYNGRNYQPKEIKTVNSKNETNYSRIKYNVDYTLSGNNPAWLKQLADRKITAYPVEKLVIKQTSGGAAMVTGGMLTTYRNDKPVPDKIYVLDINSPIPLSSFTESAVDGSGNFIKDSHYREAISLNGYDVYNNLTEQQKTNDINTSYIWDYTALLPVAEVSNADLSSVAYTSFEAEGNGYWNIGSTGRANSGVTGSRSYQLSNGAITKNGLNTSVAYTVSYWSTNGICTVSGNLASPVQGKTITINGTSWTYYEHTVSGIGTLSVSGTGLIDELRLYPKTAQMVTYAYTPLIGMTSQCDVRNQLIYYEYDGLGRLLRIRDEDSKILKQYEYQYQAVGHNSAIWTVTGNTRCKPCPANSNYITNIEQHEEKDTNPNSATYNQTRWTDYGNTSNCVPAADWQWTSTPIRCKTVGGQNTGEQERERRDVNPCSSTYNQTQWIVIGTNTTACPLPCNSSNCQGDDRKCINGTCEQGVRVCTSSEPQGNGMYLNIYHYEWSDGSWSGNFGEYSWDACF